MTAGMEVQSTKKLQLYSGRHNHELAEDVAGVLEGPLDEARRAEACRFGDAVHDSARYGWRWMFGRSSG